MAFLDHYLNRGELTQRRSTKDFCLWINEKMLQWSDRSVRDDKELKKAVLLRKGLFQNFYHERLTLAKYIEAQRIVDRNRECQLTCSSHLNYDGILYENDSAIPVEITRFVAADTHLRMETLIQKGRVSMTAQVHSTGTKKTGRDTFYDDSWASHEQAIHETSRGLSQCLLRKTTGRTANQLYSADTILLIGLDDSMIDPEDQHPIQEQFEHSIELTSHSFKSIYIVGDMGRLFLPFET